MGHCAPASVRLRILRLRSRQRSLRLLLPVVLRLTVAVISRSTGSQEHSRRQHSCRHRREQRRGGQCFQVQPESAAAITSRQRNSSRSLSSPPLICHRLVPASHLPRPLCVSVSVCRAPVCMTAWTGRPLLRRSSGLGSVSSLPSQQSAQHALRSCQFSPLQSRSAPSASMSAHPCCRLFLCLPVCSRCGRSPHPVSQHSLRPPRSDCRLCLRRV